ncbi:hypothetical protein B3C1_14445 [Gallaecimonas xiamenensis 3-C-1]|uniref:Phage shock protein B n=2 Tax=Gallaecimonas TaxID=745410 RepID=K2JXB1_9GAMM|nr:hypothetical protein B3C1_14445 [Gallaecimonas xiamenensis 3-C-1]
MVVAIVALSVGFGTLYDAYVRRLKLQETRIKAESQNGAGNQALQEKIAKMEERIRVLEAIVTDEGYQLSNKIRELDPASKAS